jgi:hypothetical protein
MKLSPVANFIKLFSILFAAICILPQVLIKVMPLGV